MSCRVSPHNAPYEALIAVISFRTHGLVAPAEEWGKADGDVAQYILFFICHVIGLNLEGEGG